MTAALIVLYVIGLLIGIFWAGKADNETIVGVGVLWPIVLAVAIAASPFYGLYVLGRRYRAKGLCRVCSSFVYLDKMYAAGTCGNECYTKWIHKMMG